MNRYDNWVSMKLNLPPEVIHQLDLNRGSKSRAAMIIELLSDQLRDYETTYEVTTHESERKL